LVESSSEGVSTYVDRLLYRPLIPTAAKAVVRHFGFIACTDSGASSIDGVPLSFVELLGYRCMGVRLTDDDKRVPRNWNVVIETALI
jgi:hypothetical protein